MKKITNFINESLNYQQANDELLARCETYVKRQKYSEDDIFDHEDEFRDVVLKQMLDDKTISKSMYNKLLNDDDLWDDLLTSLTEGDGDY